MGVSENVVYPKKPNGFADHYPYEKWLAIIRNINPTFSDKPKQSSWRIKTHPLAPQNRTPPAHIVPGPGTRRSNRGCGCRPETTKLACGALHKMGLP